MKRILTRLVCAAVCGFGSLTIAQDVKSDYAGVMKLIPAETFLWAATTNIATGFHEMASRWERCGLTEKGGKLDRNLIRLLPVRRPDSNDSSFVGTLATLGIKTDGAAAWGLMILTNQNGQAHMDDDLFICLLPIARQDALESALLPELRNNAPRQNLAACRA